MNTAHDLLDAEIVPLWSLLIANQNEQSSLFFVPSYQRPYAWEKRQLEDFWNDISLSFLQTPDNPYLLGTLYVAQCDAVGLSTQVNPEVLVNYQALLSCRQHKYFLVIDGQQRLTTFFLLCHALMELKPALFEGGLPRLIPGKVDQRFFSNLVSDQIGSALTQSHHRLNYARSFLRKRLEQSGNYAMFTAFIKQQLQVVRITLKGNLELATVLFVSQTDRGKRLSVLDRLKSALVFYRQRLIASSTEPIFSPAQHSIDSLFSHLYENLERLAGIQLYAKTESAEADVIRILHALLLKREFYSDKLRDQEDKLIGWDAGEERVYDYLTTVLRNGANVSVEILEGLLDTLSETLLNINAFFEYLLVMSERERRGDFLYALDQVPWYPYLQVWGLLNPSRFSKAWLVDVFHRAFEQQIPVFTAPDNCTLRVDSLVHVEVNSESAFSQEVIDLRCKKLHLLTTKIQSESTIQEDLRLIAELPQLQQFLRIQWEATLSLCNQFAERFQNSQQSAFNLVETLELSLWKIGKNPVGNFMDYSDNVAQSLKDVAKLAQNYKQAYLLRDLSYGNYKYVLYEYERYFRVSSDMTFAKFIIEEVNREDAIEYHREHIFAQAPAILLEQIKPLWANSGGLYEDWIWRIGNITLLEGAINIGQASNLPVWEKAPCYLNSQFISTQELGRRLLNFDGLVMSATEALPEQERNLLRLAAFKLMLEIREVELLAFVFYRF